jgi:hypothetical protein
LEGKVQVCVGIGPRAAIVLPRGLRVYIAAVLGPGLGEK